MLTGIGTLLQQDDEELNWQPDPDAKIEPVRPVHHNWVFRKYPNGHVLAEIPKVGRNDLCPCGSGIKYKKCHGR